MQNIITLNTKAFGKMTDQEFFQFCQDNELLRIERDSDKNIVIMPPTGSETGNYNLKLAFAVKKWVDDHIHGEVFDSSAGFTLPNEAVRSPDVSVIRKERWNALTDADKQSFAPICPEFVIELMSPSDDLNVMQKKMKEWIENGCELGWLIDPKAEKAWIYDHKNAEPLLIDNFVEPIKGKYLMEGFKLNLKDALR